MIPRGSPLGLLFLLFLIESISLCIQPLTLSVRLMANIITGHILLGLVLRQKFMVICGGGLLIVLEVIVRRVQASVYVLLLLFYRV